MVASTDQSPMEDLTSTPGRPFPPPAIPPLHHDHHHHHHRKRAKSAAKAFRAFRSMFHSLPIIAPNCKLPALPTGMPESRRNLAGTRVTGTLFGYRRGRVSLSVQETPPSHPMVVVELAMHTSVLQKEMSSGMVRMALECERRPENERKMVLEEPLWTMYCNGKKSGYGVRREPNEEDLAVMEMLKMVSMGAGVLPGRSETEGPDGEIAYIRAHFERVVGSRDSETLYMLSPDGNNGPELSIFFVRL